MDKDFYKITKYYDDQEPQLREQQQNEIHEKINLINYDFTKLAPKPSNELFKVQKSLDLLVKQKEYIKAHDLQIRMNELMKIDEVRYEEEKERKIKKELDKLKMKHDNEHNNFQLKLNQTYTEFKKKRALELEK